MLAFLQFGAGLTLGASKFDGQHWFLIYCEKGYIAANINLF